MPAKIVLTCTEGTLKGETFAFDERTTCLLGREADCAPCVPDDQWLISRHHVLLDINPPTIRARDLGSKNGTYVNGTKIGQRQKDERPEDVDYAKFPEVDLHDGDKLALGQDYAVFQVQVLVPPACASCGAELTEAEAEAQTQALSGGVWCAACQTQQEQGLAPAPALAQPQRCASCGASLPTSESAQRTAAALCVDCRADVECLLQHLLARARTREEPLRALAGYTLLKELDKGGMGAVYLARHDQSREQVALKMMLPQIAADERAIAQFWREIELTRALHPPHVVELREAGGAEGIFFFTLEYCEGGSLKKRLDQAIRGRLPIAEACGYILQALAGLQYAHTAVVPARKADGTVEMVEGVVHRDLKPANLLLSGSGSAPVVKVGDYGIAKAFELAGLSGMSRTGDVQGTPYFMPRQLVINFKYAKPDVDVWAMAATLYHLLTGAYPRDFPKGRDPWSVVLETQPQPILQRDPTLPKPLAEVIDHALQDQPEIGFKTALEFKQALENVL